MDKSSFFRLSDLPNELVSKIVNNISDLHERQEFLYTLSKAIHWSKSAESAFLEEPMLHQNIFHRLMQVLQGTHSKCFGKCRCLKEKSNISRSNASNKMAGSEDFKSLQVDERRRDRLLQDCHLTATQLSILTHLKGIFIDELPSAVHVDRMTSLGNQLWCSRERFLNEPFRLMELGTKVMESEDVAAMKAISRFISTFKPSLLIVRHITCMDWEMWNNTISKQDCTSNCKVNTCIIYQESNCALRPIFASNHLKIVSIAAPSSAVLEDPDPIMMNFIARSIVVAVSRHWAWGGKTISFQGFDARDTSDETISVYGKTKAKLAVWRAARGSPEIEVELI